MADTGQKRYSLNESINRIFRALTGNPAPNDNPDTLSGSVFSIDEILSKLAEVLESNDPDNTLTLPDANYGDITSSGDATFAGDVTVTGTVTAEDVYANDSVTANDIIGGQAEFGDVSGGDYAQFETDGTLILNGNATTWDDLRFPALALRAPAAGAAAEPDLVQFRDDDGSSTGVFSFAFDPDTEEEMYFAAQLPHSWAGTPIEPHVHWSVMANCTGTVGWAMEYTWSEITGTFPNTVFTYADEIIPDEDNLVAYRHYMSDFPSITGSFGIGALSSMLVGRLFRDATESLTSDSCPEDVVLLELDFHYQIDRLGSREEYVR